MIERLNNLLVYRTLRYTRNIFFTVALSITYLYTLFTILKARMNKSWFSLSIPYATNLAITKLWKMPLKALDRFIKTATTTKFLSYLSPLLWQTNKNLLNAVTFSIRWYKIIVIVKKIRDELVSDHLFVYLQKSAELPGL